MPFLFLELDINYIFSFWSARISKYTFCWNLFLGRSHVKIPVWLFSFLDISPYWSHLQHGGVHPNLASLFGNIHYTVYIYCIYMYLYSSGAAIETPGVSSCLSLRAFRSPCSKTYNRVTFLHHFHVFDWWSYIAKLYMT